MAVYFGFWIISLGFIIIGSLESVNSDHAVGAGFLGVILLVGGDIYKGTYRWSGVFGLTGAGVLMLALGNALSYVREDGIVVDNLLMPYGAIIISIGILLAACLTVLFVWRCLYNRVSRQLLRRQKKL